MLWARRGRTSRWLGALLALGMVGIPLTSRASAPKGATVSSASPVVRWRGGPLYGSSTSAGLCFNAACDVLYLAIDVPAEHWRRSPGGVVIRVEWEDKANEADLLILDDAGREVGRSDQLHTNFEQTFFVAPKRGNYRVIVEAPAPFTAINLAYAGEARLVEHQVPLAPTAPSTMRFAPPTLVDPQLWAAEPSVWATEDGSIFAAAPWGVTALTSFAWRSVDGGRTFQLLDSRPGGLVADPRRRPCTESGGGGDIDVVSDRTGRVYLSDLEGASVAIGTSTDQGDTWQCNAWAASTPEADRPWLAPSPTADGPGPNVDAYHSYRDLVVGGLRGGDQVKPRRLHLDVTRDGGRTWGKQGEFAPDLVAAPGPLFTGPDSTLYQVFEGDNAVWLARSRDQGKTFDVLRVSERLTSPANVWPAGDVDAAGNVHVAWVDGGTFDVVYSQSTDQGAQWSPPARLNPPSSETAMMPWVAAGKGGDVAIAWYGTPGMARAQDAPTSAAWHAWVARSAPGPARPPRFEVGRLTDTPMHFGGICNPQTSCPGDIRLRDFFEIDIAPSGALIAVFNDNGRIQQSSASSPPPYVVAARQVSGLGMTEAAARRAARNVEAYGEARYPPRSTNGRNVPAADFVTVPGVEPSGDHLQLSFSLGSARDLTEVLRPGGTTLGTDAYWIAVWKANDRVEYAGMHVDAGGSPSFFGGDEPVGVTQPENLAEKWASYPAQFALEGMVDRSSGAVTIGLPMKRYHLRPGDQLHSLQAFSMLALLPERMPYLIPEVLDITPARTVRIGSSG